MGIVAALTEESRFRMEFSRVLEDNGISSHDVIDYGVDPNVTFEDFIFYFDRLPAETRMELSVRLSRLCEEGFHVFRDNLHYLINTYKY